MFEVTGKIKVINEEQVISDKFKKREFVVEEADAKFPNILMFELTQDKTGDINSFNVGDDVKVSFNIRGREWNSPQKGIMYFTSLNAWRIENVGASNGAPIQEQAPVDTLTPSNDGDDLPF